VEIKQYVDHLFKDVPDTTDKEILKQEIIDNLEEKVRDLVDQGKKPEEAIQLTITDFGNIEELKMELLMTQHELKKNTAKLNLGFSVFGSVLIIALFVFMNFYYSPEIIWFVYPTFVVLWWPLSMFFYWLRKK
jgi:hypothetical protein